MAIFGAPNIKKLAASGNVNRLAKALGYKKSHEVRRAAANALDQLGWKPDSGKHKASYWVAKGDWVKAAALGTSAVEALGLALKDTDQYFRYRAAVTLGRMENLKNLDPLIGALDDQSHEVRQAAAKALDQLGWKPDLRKHKASYWVAKGDWEKAAALGPSAAEPLATAIQDEDHHIRCSAAKVLAKTGAEQAIEHLIMALKDKNRYVRRTAALSLSQIGDAAVHKLLAALKDQDRFMRHRAAEALGKIGNSAAVKPLVGALGDQDRYVRWAAAEALDQLGWKPDLRKHKASYWVAKGDWEKAAALGPSAVDLLISSLKDDSFPIRRAAAKTLAAIGDCAVGPLIRCLKNKDKFMRHMAAEALGKIGNIAAVKPLVGALGDQDRYVRWAAAEALGEFGSTEAVFPLKAALEDKDRSVRLAAAQALEKISQ